MHRKPALTCGRLAAPAALALTLGALTASAALAAGPDIVLADQNHGGAGHGPLLVTSRQPTPSGGSGAPGVRLSLLAALSLALGCGIVAQYQSTGSRRRNPDRPDHLHLVEPASDAPDGAAPHAPPGDAHAGAAQPGPGYRRALHPHKPRDEGSASRPRGQAGGRTRRGTWAEEQCDRAVGAALAYDRAATLRAFLAALRSDPDVRPTAAPGYWEMPPGGHADLARAYLRCGRPLDARSVLTVALLSFPHHRELRALLDDAVNDER